MPTYTYTVNRDTLIKGAFRLIGQFNDDSPAPQTDINNAAEALNLMIKYWMSKNYNLWCYSDVLFAPTVGQTQYQIGPANLLAPFRPLRIPSARLQYTSVTPFLEVPLIELSRQEYDMLGTKQSAGTPNSYYYDPQTVNGLLNLYLNPSQLPPYNVILNCQRPIADVLNGTDAFDFPIEWNLALKYGLAKELIPEYFVPDNVANRVEKRADEYLNEMLNWDQEDAATFFTPDYRGMKRG